MTAPVDVNTCCAITYSHPIVGWLLGDSLHPGGLALTTRLASAMGVETGSTVLDAGSGRGASAVHLARTVGCRVTGVTLEDDGVKAGYELARRHGVEDRLSFLQGDLQRLDMEPESFDFVVMECVLSILSDKSAALQRLHSLVRPGGRLGLTDVTVSGSLPGELQGVLATAGCVGGALSLSEYAAMAEEHGFVVERTDECEGEVSSFLRDIRGKLLIAEVAFGLGKLPIGDGLLAIVEEQVQLGVLGYGLLVARKLV